MLKAINIMWDVDYDDNGYLPTEIIIPEGMTDEDDISDYISDEIGFCHDGFELEEIKQFADALCFTESEAKNVTDLFYNLKTENPINHWRVALPLDDVDEYIREWENHWHRETNIEECFKCEKDGEYYSYDPELAKEIFSSVEAFKKYAMEGKTQFVYQLPDSDMVVVVC